VVPDRTARRALTPDRCERTIEADGRPDDRLTSWLRGWRFWAAAMERARATTQRTRRGTSGTTAGALTTRTR